MKNFTFFILIALIVSCNQPDSNKSENTAVTDTSNSNNPGTTSLPDLENKAKDKGGPFHSKANDTLLMQVSTEILHYIKIRNYKKLASYINTKDGLLFSPYAFIDTTNSQVLSSNQLIKLAKQNKAINWGSPWDDETDKPKLMTINQYFNRFVYDVDFLNAELKSINKFHSQGTDLNNITKMYPDCDVVEFFFSGFEKKYEGMDFRALRLVLKTENIKPHLIAIIHDEWTP